MTDAELTRRRLLERGLAVVPAAVLAAGAGRFLEDADGAVRLAATPQIADADDPTPALTEGPYFTPSRRCASRSWPPAPAGRACGSPDAC